MVAACLPHVCLSEITFERRISQVAPPFALAETDKRDYHVTFQQTSAKPNIPDGTRKLEGHVEFAGSLIIHKNMTGHIQINIRVSTIEFKI